MLRAVLVGAIAVSVVVVAALALRPQEEPPPVAYHSLEREIARVTLQGEHLLGRGDTCLEAVRAGDAAALGQCRSYLVEAARYSEPLDAVGRRLAELDDRLNDGELIAVGASGSEAVEALAALASVTARLGNQIELVDAWMAQTAQAGETAARRAAD